MSLPPPPVQAELFKAAATHGVDKFPLRWLIDEAKRPIYEILRQNQPGTYVMSSSRRVGKSWLMAVLITEYALRYPGERLILALPTSSMAGEIYSALFDEIYQHAPKKLCPVMNKQDHVWMWPNGSKLSAFGSEDVLKCNRGRGTKARAAFGDELGFSAEVDYAVSSIIAPQLIQTNGSIILASSPPLSPDHPFCAYEDAAREQPGHFFHLDIFTPGLDGIPDPHGFVKSRAVARGMTVEQFQATDEYRRELMGMRVVDSTRAVFPEWQEIKDECVCVFQLPAHPIWYEAVDLGFLRHKTGYLLAAFDFAQQKLLIQDELLLTRATTAQLASHVLAKRAMHLQGRRIHTAVMDDPSGRIIADLAEQHGLHFLPPRKPDWDAALAQARLYVQQGKVVVHPRCKNLLHQMNTGLTDKKGQLRDDGSAGHLDLLACLVYLVRHAHDNRHINPTPAPARSNGNEYWERGTPVGGLAGAFRRMGVR